MVAIHGYSIYQKYKNANGGGVAVYIQNHIPVKLRDDLMLNTVEVIWLQVHLPHLKSILVGSCYRPPSAKYLDNVCEMLDNVCDTNREVYFLGDLNIDWLSSFCPLRKILLTVTSACNLDHVILRALVLSHLDYCSVVWSGATRKDLQLAKNRAARLDLGCTQ